MEIPKYLTIKDAGKIFQMPDHSIRMLCNTKKIKGYHVIGRNWEVKTKSVIQYIQNKLATVKGEKSFAYLQFYKDNPDFLNEITIIPEKEKIC